MCLRINAYLWSYDRGRGRDVRPGPRLDGSTEMREFDSALAGRRSRMKCYRFEPTFIIEEFTSCSNKHFQAPHARNSAAAGGPGATNGK